MLSGGLRSEFCATPWGHMQQRAMHVDWGGLLNGSPARIRGDSGLTRTCGIDGAPDSLAKRNVERQGDELTPAHLPDEGLAAVHPRARQVHRSLGGGYLRGGLQEGLQRASRGPEAQEQLLVGLAALWPAPWTCSHKRKASLNAANTRCAC